MISKKIPLIPRTILYFLAKPGSKPEILGDIEEEFPVIYLKKGRIKAYFWLFSQIFVPAVFFLGSYIKWSSAMLKNYIKVALRNLNKHRGHSALNISGLAAGIACSILILLYIQFHLSFDNYHEGVDRTYLVGLESRSETGSSYYFVNYTPIGLVIRNNYPEVDMVARRTGWSRVVQVKYGEKIFYEKWVNFAEEQIFNVFDIPFISGKPEGSLNRPNTGVITQRIAEKYFGDEDPIGKIMSIEFRDIEITGVIENAPENTHFNYEVIISWETTKSMNWAQDWGALVTFVYTRLKPGVDHVEFEKKIAWIAHDHIGETLEQRSIERINFLQPVKDIHLFPRRSDRKVSGNLLNLYIFGLVGIFILLISSMNFMNLSTARYIYRAKEVGMRKVIGARKGQLVRQYLGESIINTAIAFVLGIMISFTVMSVFNDLAGTKFVTRDLLKIEIILSYLGLLLFIGFTAGSYPAVFLSSFAPSGIFKGNSKEGLRGVFVRKSLVTVQFTICIVLMVGTIIVHRQVDFMKNQDLGFSEEQKLVIILPGWRMITDNYETVKAEFSRHSSVQGVTAASGVPGMGINNLYIFPSGQETERNRLPSCLRCDQDFIPEYNLEIIAGRQFNPMISSEINGGAFILNEKLVSSFGWSSPEEAIGKELGENRIPVIGVVRDFHWYGLQGEIEPLIMVHRPALFKYITLNISTEDLDRTLSFVENRYRELFPGQIFEYFFVDDNFDQQYRNEEKLGKMFSVFSFLGIFIACLGLFGLASFTAEQKTKEIGIRKVLGSSVTGILVMISKDFIKWISISMILAFPAGYLITAFWLQNFAYRISPGVLPFLSAGGLAFVITIISIGYQAVKSANADPVNALKYE